MTTAMQQNSHDTCPVLDVLPYRQHSIPGFDMPVLRSRDRAEREKMALDFLSGRRKLSYSAFSKFKKSPDLFLRDRLDRERKQTAAMLEGKVFHCLVLEPHRFNAEYVLAYEGKTPSSAQQQQFISAIVAGASSLEAYSGAYSTKGKSAEKICNEADELIKEFQGYLDWAGQVGKRDVVSHKVVEKCLLIADAVMSDRQARECIELVASTGAFEAKTEWQYADLSWIGYMDGYAPGELILDLKKNRDASYRKVASQIKFEGWADQAAFYSNATGLWDKPYALIAADNDYQVSVTEITKADRVAAHRLNNWYVERFLECLINPDLFLQSYAFYPPNNI